MLPELVFLGCHSQFVSYPYTFTSYSYGCIILKPYVGATERMHSDAILSSTGALLMKTVMKNTRGGGQLAQILGRYVPWQNQKVDP